MKLCHDELRIFHGFYTRLGGVSQGPYRSLNAAYHTGDDSCLVDINRQRIIHDLTGRLYPVVTATQVHGNRVMVVTPDNMEQVAKIQADALITSTKGIAIGVLTADCAPILVHDPSSGMVAAIHAGWRGAVLGIIAHTIDAMIQGGAKLNQLCAVIGPCIRVESYEIQNDFYVQLSQQDHESIPFFMNERYFDLPGYVKHKLHRTGIVKVFDLEQDTYRQPAWWFSHRYVQHWGYVQHSGLEHRLNTVQSGAFSPSGRQLSLLMVDG